MQILIVVVLYKMALDQSETIKCLCAAFAESPRLLDSIGLLVWDNSPVPLDIPQLDFPFEYRHTGKNLGVSGAYNRTLEIAEALDSPWILLLDQDTTLPRSFLTRMLEYSVQEQDNGMVAAIAPFLFDGSRPLSPVLVLRHGVRIMSPPYSGMCPAEVFAANSGTLMRVSTLREIGGYDERFWLDFSDVVVFHRLYRNGKRLYVAGDLHLQHTIAIYDYEANMSPQRYETFIAAEGAYWDLFRDPVSNLIQTARLLARVLIQHHRYTNKRYSQISLGYLRERLLTSKRDRLLKWEQQSAQRNIPAVR